MSHYDDLAALEVGLIENLAREDLNPVEEARAIATLAKEFGLTYPKIGDRVGRHRSVVSNMVRLLNLSEEILELLERGELSWGHGVALLQAKDLQSRSQLARAAIEEGWTVRTLEARASASNVDALESQQDHGEQAQIPKQVQDLGRSGRRSGMGRSAGRRGACPPSASSAAANGGGIRLRHRGDCLGRPVGRCDRSGLEGLLAEGQDSAPCGALGAPLTTTAIWLPSFLFTKPKRSKHVQSTINIR